jgi:hypothetical protein
VIEESLAWFRSLRKEQSVLVCEWNGFGLRAGVVFQREQQVQLSEIVRADRLSPVNALSDVIGQLHDKGVAVPETGVLLLPSAVSEVIELPPDTGMDQSDEAMNELIRWELDPLMAEQAANWSLGTVLLGLGMLDEEQRRSLESLTGKAGSDRFGELALGIGLVEQSQVDEALAFQSGLQEMGEEIDCAWRLLPGESSRWLATGVSRSQKSLWVDAFLQNKIQLSALYPLVGASAFAFGGTRPEAVVLELYPGIVVAQRLEGALPARFARVYESEDRTLIEDCCSAVQSAAEGELASVSLFPGGSLPPGFFEEAADAFGVPLECIEPEEFPAGSAGIWGVGLQELSASEDIPFPKLSTLPRPVPIWKRPYALEIGLVLVLVFSIVSLEASFYRGNSELVREREAAREKLTTLQIAKDAVEAEKEALVQGKGELDSLELGLASAGERLRLLKEEVPARRKLIRYFLSALSASVSPGVVIEGVFEVEEAVFEITGWSFGEKAAQQFIQELAVLMSRKGFEVRDELVSARMRSMSGSGYGISLRLERRTETLEGTL